MSGEPLNHLERTRAWLEERYATVSSDGVYFAHQPIYGFREGHCEHWLAGRYVRTLQILRVLARLRWSTLLDVGASEGYKAHLARQLLGGTRVVSSDLSSEACGRAAEIYGLETAVADVQRLPFADGEFDVVTCSETLEHVPEFEVAVGELLRVAHSAVVITVPHQRLATPPTQTRLPHDHLHALTTRSLDFLRHEQLEVRATRIVSPLTPTLGGLIEGNSCRDHPSGRRVPPPAQLAYDGLAQIASRALGERAEAALVEADRLLCRILPLHRAILFVVVKNPAVKLLQPRRRIAALEVIRARVPLHPS